MPERLVRSVTSSTFRESAKRGRMPNGALLIEDSLAQAQRAGWARVILVGDAPYYRRFGFEKLTGVEMPPPTNPDRVLGRALVPGAWDGVAGLVEPDRP